MCEIRYRGRMLGRMTAGLLLTLLPTTAVAQGPSDASAPAARALYGYLGGGGSDTATSGGGALVAGVVGRVGPLLATFTPLDLVLFPGDSNYQDPFNFRPGCRSSYATPFERGESVCVGATYAFSVDAAVLIPRTPFFAGAGARFERRDAQPLGTAGYAWFGRDKAVMLIFKGMFGTDLTSGVVIVGFRFAGR